MEKYGPYLDWIHGEHDKMVELLEALSNINSWSFNPAGVQKVIYLLSKSTIGLNALSDQSIFDLPHYKRVNCRGDIEQVPLGPALHIVKRPESPVKILLCIHADTVYPPDNPFQKAEFPKKNIMRGPGVTDAKGGILVMLKALEAFERSPWAENLGWEVFINPDEEISGAASANFFEEAAKRNKCGLLFEPLLQNGSMVNRRKGSGNYVVKFTGKSAHAGRPQLGINAVAAAANLALQIYEFHGRLQGLTTNPAMIEGGGPNNVVPDLALLHFNIRMQNKEDLATIENFLEVAIERTSSIYGAGIEIVSRHISPPKELDDSVFRIITGITSCGSDLDLEMKWEESGGLSDGNRLSAYGLPCIDSLGVRGGNIHSPEEFIYLDSLVERAKLTALFLMRVASGEIVLS